MGWRAAPPVLGRAACGGFALRSLWSSTPLASNFLSRRFCFQGPALCFAFQFESQSFIFESLTLLFPFQFQGLTLLLEGLPFLFPVTFGPLKGFQLFPEIRNRYGGMFRGRQSSSPPKFMPTRSKLGAGTSKRSGSSPLEIC
uniref:Uncharacterized protein n=1 Tax=Sphaerodactylus townsendi TaxID=933632 RepID=A0ACB8FQK3_9SAUR